MRQPSESVGPLRWEAFTLEQLQSMIALHRTEAGQMCVVAVYCLLMVDGKHLERVPIFPFSVPVWILPYYGDSSGSAAADPRLYRYHIILCPASWQGTLSHEQVQENRWAEWVSWLFAYQYFLEHLQLFTKKAANLKSCPMDICQLTCKNTWIYHLCTVYNVCIIHSYSSRMNPSIIYNITHQAQKSSYLHLHDENGPSLPHTHIHTHTQESPKSPKHKSSCRARIYSFRWDIWTIDSLSWATTRVGLFGYAWIPTLVCAVKAVWYPHPCP